MSTFAVVTLGCKTNQFESAAMQELLQGAGFRQVALEEGADLVVVNTCTVTSATDAQSRNIIRRARRYNERCRIVVTGCYAQIDPAALEAIPGVCLVLGNEEKGRLLDLLAREGRYVSDIRSARTASVPTLSVFAERSRAFVQIQNGCDAFCAYCIIPYARGPSRSVAPDEVVAQVRRLTQAGYLEIVLTGIHIGGYGGDLRPPTTLLHLVRRLEAETEARRLRLGSLEPTEIPLELVETVAASRVICPHFHIPLQSGDDAVLRRMNRSGDVASFRRLAETIRTLLPDAAIGLDLIAGFPGETEEEFGRTLRLVEELPVTHLHVFPFSRRPGTPAATMAGQLFGDVIRERAARLREVGERKERSFAASFVGRELEVVIEGGTEGGMRRGLSRNYLTVRFPAGEAREGGIARVRATGWTSEGLVGELLP